MKPNYEDPNRAQRHSEKVRGWAWCNLCRTWKSVAEFYPHPTTKLAIRSQCKVCQLEAARLKTAGLHAKQLGSPATRRKVELLAQFPDGNCARCNYNACVAALHLHHIHSESKNSGALRREWELAKAEADKCAVLCANCHAELHDGLWKPEWIKSSFGYTLRSNIDFL